MRICRSQNCGNAPKNEFLESFFADWLEGKDIKARLAEGYTFEGGGWTGEQSLEACRAFLHHLPDLEELRVLDAVTHGKKGALDLLAERKGNRRLHVGIFIQFETLKAEKISHLKIVMA